MNFEINKGGQQWTLVVLKIKTMESKPKQSKETQHLTSNFKKTKEVHKTL
jgi:hypothetical protein